MIHINPEDFDFDYAIEENINMDEHLDEYYREMFPMNEHDELEKGDTYI